MLNLLHTRNDFSAFNLQSIQISFTGFTTPRGVFVTSGNGVPLFEGRVFGAINIEGQHVYVLQIENQFFYGETSRIAWDNYWNTWTNRPNWTKIDSRAVEPWTDLEIMGHSVYFLWNESEEVSSSNRLYESGFGNTVENWGLVPDEYLNCVELYIASIPTHEHLIYQYGYLPLLSVEVVEVVSLPETNTERFLQTEVFSPILKPEVFGPLNSIPEDYSLTDLKELINTSLYTVMDLRIIRLRSAVGNFRYYELVV